MTTIERITIRRFELPLQVPYKLAFGPVMHFDTLVVEVRMSSGCVGLGEATILNGYTDETVEGSWRQFQVIAGMLPGKDVGEARQIIAPFWADSPFTATAFLSALEMAEQESPFFAFEGPKHVPILGVLNAREEAGIERELNQLLSQGFKTIKVKVGFDPDKDSEQVRLVQKHLGMRAAIRIDGNQGFTREQALSFVKTLNPEGIELLEQPCHADDWDSAVSVAQASPVPMMLDESIYSEQDIETAAALGCATFIKLKLMKLGSMTRLRKALQRIKSLGMKPVLGNGVASDIGCWMESLVARLEVSNAGEMNGFLKPSHSILTRPLQFAQGCVLLEKDFTPMLNEEVVRSCQRSAKDFS